MGDFFRGAGRLIPAAADFFGRPFFSGRTQGGGAGRGADASPGGNAPFFPDAPMSRRSFLKSAALFAFLFGSGKDSSAMKIKGVEYVSAAYVAKRFGMKYKTLSPRKAQRVYGSGVSMDFSVHKRDMSLNGLKIWLGFPVAENGGMLYIALADVENTLVPILQPHRLKPPPPLSHIVIDAGHGGKDKGAMNTPLGLYEKNLTLDISRKLAKILRARGYRVTLTRDRDVFIELPDRPLKANRLGADMFVSVHINAAGPSASGVETYALTPRWQTSTNASGVTAADKRLLAGNSMDDWNTLLAYYLQREIAAATKAEDRGVKRARFAVLRDAKMPAALIECGFISNSAEARNLGSDAYRAKIAKAAADGIARYASTISRFKKK